MCSCVDVSVTNVTSHLIFSSRNIHQQFECDYMFNTAPLRRITNMLVEWGQPPTESSIQHHVLFGQGFDHINREEEVAENMRHIMRLYECNLYEV